MKHLASLSIVIGLLGLPIPAHAQGLSQQAAGCAINLSLFRIFQVTGVWVSSSNDDFANWSSYLINGYPALPEPYLVANACAEIEAIPQNWALIPEAERQKWRDQAAASVPHDLALLAPVSPRAAQLRRELDAPATPPPPPLATGPNSEAEAIAELERQRRNSESLRRFNQNFYGR
jgi:hypothetical protein